MEHKVFVFDTGKFHAETEPEWMEAYDDLCRLCEDALQQHKGLLLTFTSLLQ